MSANGVVRRLSKQLGIATVLGSGMNVHLILFTRFARMSAYGSSTLILALYFAALEYSDTEIGLFMTLTLIGDVLISLLLTVVADSLGRRRILTLGSLLMALSGVCFATATSYWILLLAAVVGVISPSGNEIGPFRAVEESTLAHLSEAETRSDIFAWYVVLGTLGASLGSLACGWITQALQSGGWTEIASFRLVFWVYAAIGVVKAAVTLLLDHRCEASVFRTTHASFTDEQAEGGEGSEGFLLMERQPSEAAPRSPPKWKSMFAQISRKSRRTLVKLCGLFFFDSLASGMVPNSLIAFYLERKFAMSEGRLGSIISVAQFMSSLGNVFASSIAKRIGLVRAMVYTHLPSAIFLALLPAPSSLFLTVVLLVARASLASMDQAPRSAFLSAVVLPEERTAVMGIVNTVKTMSQSSGPLITGSLAGSDRFWIAFVVAGSLKVGYDLGMLHMFLNIKLEGDRGAQNPETNERERATVHEELHALASDDDDDGELELDDLKPPNS
ncbi:MFS general substrate transporter [Polychaeton citri CBS 116435]|uniref:MFS general substrate transporter n=1 Tax=Polychaeton citri CBS 116435 TaxID=1314669 RepID=A0A9P4QER6_9PEZI|nr:MFS general substrate transporter [Polychaeton citri CBS 116435]